MPDMLHDRLSAPGHWSSVNAIVLPAPHQTQKKRVWEVGPLRLYCLCAVSLEEDKAHGHPSKWIRFVLVML